MRSIFIFKFLLVFFYISDWRPPIWSLRSVRAPHGARRPCSARLMARLAARGRALRALMLSLALSGRPPRGPRKRAPVRGGLGYLMWSLRSSARAGGAL